MHIPPYLVLLASLGISLSQANASLLLSDPFAYATGSLTGANGGTGWAAGWTASGTGSTVSTPGFTYTDSNLATQPVSGNKADWVNNNNGNFRLATDSPDAIGSTLYISFLAQTTGTGGYAGLSLFQGTGTENLFLGRATSQTNWGVDPKGGTAGVSTTAATGLSLLVYRIDFTATPTIRLYVNPTLNSEPAVASATASKTAPFTWDTVRIQSGSGISGALDEIRIGTTYADVAPVPEPATTGLIVAGALGLAARRRRRSA